MQKLKIYLDNCCYNRPYDDQSQLRIELETKAKLFIQQLIFDRKVESVWSYVLEYENNLNKIIAKRNEISKWRNLAENIVTSNLNVENYAEKITKAGIKPLDALHVACSIYSECNYFITVDDRLLKYNDNKIQIINPFEFISLFGG